MLYFAYIYKEKVREKKIQVREREREKREREEREREESLSLEKWASLSQEGVKNRRKIKKEKKRNFKREKERTEKNPLHFIVGFAFFLLFNMQMINMSLSMYASYSSINFTLFLLTLYPC